MKESKQERFKRLAEARVNKIISMLKLLGNCSFTGNYEYTDEQVETIFDALHSELELAYKRFKCAVKGTGKFSLSDDICEEEFPSVTLQLPDGSRLRASAVDDENFPAVNIWLQTAKSIKEQLVCFVEYNEERDNGKKLCIGICSPGSEDPAYYKSFDDIKMEEGDIESTLKYL